MSSGQNKHDEVKRLMGSLTENLQSPSLSKSQLLQNLDSLKIYGRDPKNSEAIFCRSGIETLSKYVFGDYPPEASHEASRCVANALLLSPALRQVSVDLGLPARAADRLCIPNDDDEFLMSRLLFLSSYQTDLDLDTIIEEHHLAENIDKQLKRHDLHMKDSDSPPSSSTMAIMALSETLKLLFSVSNAAPGHVQKFSASVASLFALLQKCPIPSPPFQPPVSSLIHTLANLDYTDLSLAEDASAANESHSDHVFVSVVDKLVSILDKTLQTQVASQLETSVVPLLTVLRKMCDIAPENGKKHMQRLLLPATESRDQPIGRGSDLPSQLLRLTTSSGMTSLSESISGLMFELSDQDANKYVLNVGYGFAAGYLATHGIPVPEIAQKTKPDDQHNGAIPINPITGQRLDRELGEREPTMTEEEKELEAERLFVLFERLKATGVVDVENPVQKAMEEGRMNSRVEELSDSE